MIYKMNTYTISDAAKNIDVETHVLRYWEEELGLKIKRNDLGHRYYDENDINIFREIKQLRTKGLMLKEIKQGIERTKYKENQTEIIVRDELSQNRNTQNQYSQDEMQDCDKKINDKINDKNKNRYNETDDRANDGVIIELSKVIAYKKEQLQLTINQLLANAFMENKTIITDSLKEEIAVDVLQQLENKIREQEEKSADRYKQLDENIRALQKRNEEIAATKSRRHLFRRR